MSRLKIQGRVGLPSELTHDDLARMSSQVADVGSVVAGRRGVAVKLTELLRAARVEEDATRLRLTSGDGGFSAEVPLAGMRDALVLYALDGGPLPAELGGPLRLLIPDAARCGDAEVDTCANVKDLARIEVLGGP